MLALNMDVAVDWFNGYYQKKFRNQKEANNYFEDNIYLKIYECHPLVNSAWVKLHYQTENPLELEFKQNDHEWNFLHPLFNPTWYQTLYLEKESLGGINPYEHFFTTGHKLSNSIHPNLNTKLFLKQFPNTGYLDAVTHLGKIIMHDDYRSLRKIKFGQSPILNEQIDWNYLYPALAWGWI